MGSYLELGSYDDQLKWSEIVHNLQQESIVTCMNGQGFDYLRTPFVPSIPWEPKTRQEMARFGFGITLETPQGFEDPNQPVVDLLGAEEREAFIDALLGPDLNGDGCLQTARSQYLQKIDDANEQMADAMADLRARVSADERWVELDAELSACLAEAGFVAGSRDELVRALFEELSAASAKDPIPQSARDRERDGALAWWDCEEPLRAERAELRAGYEQEFIEEYGVQLELIKTSLEETLRENS